MEGNGLIVLKYIKILIFFLLLFIGNTFKCVNVYRGVSGR